MPRPWRFTPHDESLVRRLSRDGGVSPLTAQVLVARGCTTSEEADRFLNPRLPDLHDPELMPGLADAADRLVAAVKSGRRITIYGDYDVDGVTATSLLWHCLRLAGGEVDYYIPSRLEEGYGLNCDALQTLFDEDPGRLVVSVDCGIASINEAALARELGLELVVTDHHTFAVSDDDGDGTPRLPDAACVVHPRLPGDYPFGELCGAGVAFKLAWAVCGRLGDGKKASPRMREYLLSALGLAALGTVADVVPLIDENRTIVRFGLHSLMQRASIGMQALMKKAGVESGRPVSAEDVAFSLAPRINAAGRLGQARLAVELLTTDNPERAVALADYLDELNKNRRTVERRIMRQAKELVEANPEWNDHAALVLAHEDWHAGVIGIVASRVAEHFEKPAVMISLDAAAKTGQGSGRSFAGFDLHSGLSACAENLTSFGGHPAAAGLRIDADNVDRFREDFARYAAEHHDVGNGDREIVVDAEVRLADCTFDAVRELEKLGPFGRDNARPVFVASQVEPAQPPRKIGKDERTLLLQVRQYGAVLKAIAFGRPEWADEITECNGPFSICFTAGLNHFRGRATVELQLKDWRPEAGQQSAAG